MNVLDISILALMIFLVIRGVMRGFFREVASLAGVVCGIWFGIVYQPKVETYLETYFSTISFLPLLAFGIIFTAVLCSCNLVGWLLKTVVNKLFFGWADRSLGAGLAVLKGVIITYLAIVLITFAVPSQSPLISQSKLVPVIVASYQAVTGMISPGAYQKWRFRLFGKPSGQPKPASPAESGAES
ncbi:MAG: CvpA family protein [Desulfatiglandaceae bacterium]